MEDTSALIRKSSWTTLPRGHCGTRDKGRDCRLRLLALNNHCALLQLQLHRWSTHINNKSHSVPQNQGKHCSSTTHPQRPHTLWPEGWWLHTSSTGRPTWATASFLPASWALLPPKAEMMGSYVISPLCLLQVSKLDRKSEDFSPLLVATLGLSYQRSAAVSPENSCHTPPLPALFQFWYLSHVLMNVWEKKGTFKESVNERPQDFRHILYSVGLWCLCYRPHSLSL